MMMSSSDMLSGEIPSELLKVFLRSPLGSNVIKLLNMKNRSILLYFLTTVILHISKADICQICSCSTQEDALVFVNCHKAKITHINIIRFGLISVDYNETLTVLDLSRNNITHLPVDMFKSSQRLKMINLSNNSLQDIHESTIENLNKLETLNLSNNNIKTINLTIVPSLRILNLSHNSIKELGLQLHNGRSQLTDLNLSHNKLSDSVFNTLVLLKNLKHLDLSYNDLNLLDDTNFDLLTELTTLNLSHNLIKSLSQETFPKSLIELNIAFNRLTILPTNLFNIQILNIEYNQITHGEMNQNNQYNELVFCNLSGNMLTDLPDLQLMNLKVLDLSYNHFDSIPHTLNENNYPSLEKLIFNGNFMTNIYFPSLLNLHSLTMRNMTNVDKLDRNSFININRLKKACLNLTLTDNKRLYSLDDKIFDELNLCMLDLKNNNFTYFSPMLLNLNKIKTKFEVDLEGNPFHCNCSLQWMLNDFVPWLYSVNPKLLNNLRCVTPENLKGRRMVYWFKWKEQVLCDDTRLYSSRMSAEVLKVLSNGDSVTIKISNNMLTVLVGTSIMLLVLITIGILLTKKVSLKNTRINRRF